MNVIPPHTPDHTAATVPAPRLEPHEKLRFRTAAHLAKRLHPGPVGELVSREILSFEEFGHRLASDGLTMRLVHHVMTAQLPTAGSTQ